MIEPWYEVTNRSWGAALAAAVERNPGGELIVHHEISVTFEAFYARVQELAHGLFLLGVARGDRVAIWMGNRPEWMVVQFGVYELGAALVPIHTRFPSEELAFALARAQVSTFIAEARLLNGKIDGLAVLEHLMPELFDSTPATFATPRFPHLRHVVVLGAGDAKPAGAYGFDEVGEFGRDWRSADALSRARLAVNPFDVANIVFTSGTTGFPKGGLSMHRNNMAALHHWIDRTDLRPDDRMYLGVPFATNFGCAYVSQLSVLAGNTIIIDDTFTPDTALQAIARERVSWFPGAPTMYIMLLAHPRLADFDLRALRAAIVGGAPCPPNSPTLRIVGARRCTPS